MKNYITFPSQEGNPHEIVLSTDTISGFINTDNDSELVLKTTDRTGLEIIIEHTADVALQAEFANNIRKALIAKPGVGRVPVQLPEGFVVGFVSFG